MHHMTPNEDAWIRRFMHLKILELVSVPACGHLFARVARGGCFLGVTTRSPIWAGSVMKALGDPIH
jgi:hypothetical protein